ncbi:uncharacterized protein TNCV_5067641 [Trichonephila clavipes]|uniref:Uncharacterized protein n=1 Tax=Trichonephila clavipes TaxID=2585209 RepID=A0A8X6V049_TRICX|nr:uncharacterized protein TNCV_5067641 [Trichonephila clavipes]
MCEELKTPNPFRYNHLNEFKRAAVKLTNVDRSVAIKRLRSTALNNRRAASPLMWLVKGEERWEAPDHPQGVLPQNWGGTEKNRSVTCMVLKAKGNDRRKKLALRQDEFRAP